MRLFQVAVLLSVWHRLVATAFTVTPEVSSFQRRKTRGTRVASSASDSFNGYGTVSVAPDSKYPGGSTPLYPVVPQARSGTTEGGSWYGGAEVREMREMRFAPPPIHETTTSSSTMPPSSFMNEVETDPMHAVSTTSLARTVESTTAPVPALATSTPPVPAVPTTKPVAEEFEKPVQAESVTPVARKMKADHLMPRGLAYSNANLPTNSATSPLIEKPLPVVATGEALKMDKNLSRGLAYSKIRMALLKKKRAPIAASIPRGLKYSMTRLAMMKKSQVKNGNPISSASNPVDDTMEEPLETEAEEEAIPFPRGLSYSKFRSSLFKNDSANNRSTSGTQTYDKGAVSYESMGSLIGA